MMNVHRHQRDDVVVIRLSGSIDGGDSCRAIHDAIRKALGENRRKFVFDLADVDWVNSLGTGFLVAAAVAASREGAAVRLVGLAPRVADVLEACGVVPHVWPAFPDEDQAVASFGSG